MNQLINQYHRFTINDTNTLYTGIDNIIDHIKGTFKQYGSNKKTLHDLAKEIEENSLKLRPLSDAHLKEEIKKSQTDIKLNKELSKALLIRTLSLICEVSFRTLGLRPYSVQIMGALALIDNKLIEMKPGEGKTITAALAAIVYGSKGEGCHIVTSNDYLVQRDAELMKPLYEFCGLSTGYVISTMEKEQRKENYETHITYATSKELLADYLRDNLDKNNSQDQNLDILNTLGGKNNSQPVMRGLKNALIDEADSVLVDEATTPLIISIAKDNKPFKQSTLKAYEIAQNLKKDIDYIAQNNTISFTAKGLHKIDTLTKDLTNIWKSPKWKYYLIKQSLNAREFYTKNTQYVIHEDKVVIIDENTGRMMPGRSWGGGLHQAVEAKEGVELSDPTHTHTKMSFQRFFRLYDNLCGMSGTLHNLRSELWNIYKLSTISIPTNVPSKNINFPTLIVPTLEEKYDRIIDEIKKVSITNRPILVGMRTINESEHLFELLKKEGIESTVLNALHHKTESEIIAKAGELSKITIATNIAGRGTDILLSKEVAELGGLHVISSQKHDTKRVDLQLLGRCARQGQPGSTHTILSLEDELLEKYIPNKILKLFKRFISNKAVYYSSLMSYKMIQRVLEFSNANKRKRILQQDFSLSKTLSFTDKERF